MFNRFPNPIGLNIIAKNEIIHEKNLYCSLFFEILFNKLYPEDIAVVNIAEKITKL